MSFIRGSRDREGKIYVIKQIIGGLPAYKITDRNWTNHLRWAMFYDDESKPLKLHPGQELVEVCGNIVEKETGGLLPLQMVWYILT